MKRALFLLLALVAGCAATSEQPDGLAFGSLQPNCFVLCWSDGQSTAARDRGDVAAGDFTSTRKRTTKRTTKRPHPVPLH